jgi:hypothetical protein
VCARRIFCGGMTGKDCRYVRDCVVKLFPDFCRLIVNCLVPVVLVNCCGLSSLGMDLV